MKVEYIPVLMMSRATSCGEQYSLFQQVEGTEEVTLALHTDVCEKVQDMTSNASFRSGGAGRAERRYRGYDVTFGEAREGDHQTSASRLGNARACVACGKFHDDCTSWINSPVVSLPRNVCAIILRKLLDFDHAQV